MALVINSNVASPNARRNLGKPSDRAPPRVDSVRSSMGAIQNRFESTISHPTSISESLSVARSRIHDASFATETAALSPDQIPRQAGGKVAAAQLSPAARLEPAVVNVTSPVGGPRAAY